MFQRSLTTRIHPLALIGLFVSKKMIALQLAKFYGLPKLYRRLAQANRSAFENNSVRYVGVRDAVQRLFRLPAEIDKFVVSEDFANMVNQFELKYSPLPAGTIKSVFGLKSNSK